MQTRTISIVIPIYNEAPNVAPLYRAVKSIIQKLPQSFELIFVDDGSSDDSVKRIKQVAKHTRETYVITNNHFRGQAVVNAVEIKAALEEERVPAPEPLFAHYERLKESATPPQTDDDGALPLFSS